LTDHYDQAFAVEYVRLSLLGVDNINHLTDCTKALPAVRKHFDAPDQSVMDKWLSSTKHVQQVADALRNGDTITSLMDVVNGTLDRVSRIFFVA
jgi:manganese peroxidase